jgi:hypothetical protein
LGALSLEIIAFVVLSTTIGTIELTTGAEDMIKDKIITMR